MRRRFSLLLLPLLIAPALADEPTQAEGPSKVQESPKAQESPNTGARHARMTWEQRFVQANQAHDGHLTRDEATAGYPLIAKHFDDIDVDHKGYTTENDIRAWRIMRKASRRLAHPPADKLKPQHAFQPHLDQPRVSAEQRAALADDRIVVAAVTPAGR
jgi:hypothetical protein